MESITIFNYALELVHYVVAVTPPADGRKAEVSLYCSIIIIGIIVANTIRPLLSSDMVCISYVIQTY